MSKEGEETGVYMFEKNASGFDYYYGDIYKGIKC
jgi:hypothetical protein